MIQTTIISLGHRFRHDDGVGPYVLDQLSKLLKNKVDCIENTGDIAQLLEDWRGREVYLLDAVFSDSRHSGDIVRLDGLRDKLPVSASITSSHGLNLAEAIEVGRLMDSLPTELNIYAVCGENFAPGKGLSPGIEKAAKIVTREIAARIMDYQGGLSCMNNR